MSHTALTQSARDFGNALYAGSRNRNARAVHRAMRSDDAAECNPCANEVTHVRV